MCVYIYIYIYVYMDMYAYIYIYIYTHIYTLLSPRLCPCRWGAGELVRVGDLHGVLQYITYKYYNIQHIL